MLAYCPLDLPRLNVDEIEINKLIDCYNPGHHDNIWDTLPLLGRVNSQLDFFDAPAFECAWEKRYNIEGDVLYNELLYKKLENVFQHFQKLPMLVTHAQILRAKKNVPKHFDMKHKQGKFIDDFPSINYEPNGFKILLNKTDCNSFFVCEDFSAEPKYIKLPTDTNTFVINEKRYPHGSTFISNKCIISIFGLVDVTKCNKLIEKSIEKYKNFVISF